MAMFHLHVALLMDCTPFFKKNTKAVENVVVVVTELRTNNHKNIDLWVDRSIYPRDPTTNLCPNFKSVTHLLIFECEGNSGLLGYCQRLHDIEMQSLSCLN